MPITPTTYLRCVGDGFISVRSLDGTLLGCIPGTPPEQDFINAPAPLGPVAVMAGVVFCAVPTAQQMPLLRSWPGFVPVDEANADLAQPVGGTYEKGEEP